MLQVEQDICDVVGWWMTLCLVAKALQRSKGVEMRRLSHNNRMNGTEHCDLCAVSADGDEIEVVVMVMDERLWGARVCGCLSLDCAREKSWKFRGGCSCLFIFRGLA